jgi:hypothetical protein
MERQFLFDDGGERVMHTAVQICVFTAFADVP